MDDSQRRVALARHLAEAGAAHGEYEMTALHGEYDREWAEWYAHYLLGHGWNDLFGTAWTAEELGVALRGADADHRANAPSTPWNEYYAAEFASRT
jgi:hypothetical protein